MGRGFVDTQLIDSEELYDTTSNGERGGLVDTANPFRRII
jgi:hypothetical protein